MIKIQKIGCKRCGHNWIPRTEEIRVCPKCHSAYWNVERKRNKK